MISFFQASLKMQTRPKMYNWPHEVLPYEDTFGSFISQCLLATYLLLCVMKTLCVIYLQTWSAKLHGWWCATMFWLYYAGAFFWSYLALDLVLHRPFFVLLIVLVIIILAYNLRCVNE